MPGSLRSQLAELAEGFATSVLDAIRGASLEELLTEGSGRPARPARSEVDALKARILQKLAERPS